jgi:hypothetical protein
VVHRNLGKEVGLKSAIFGSDKIIDILTEYAIMKLSLGFMLNFGAGMAEAACRKEVRLWN